MPIQHGHVARESYDPSSISAKHLQRVRNYAELLSSPHNANALRTTMMPAWAKLFRTLGSARRKSRALAGNITQAAEIAQLQEHRHKLLESPRFTDDRRLLKFGYRVYSQSDEDGILHEIFRRIGEVNRTFVELGSGTGLENNTLFLVIKGWRGTWLEGSERRVATARKSLAGPIRSGQLRVEQLFVTAANIDGAIQRFSPTRELDLLSIDLDGNDYYILEAIQSLTPRVVVMEYNAKFPADVAWIMEYNEAHRWDGTDYFGASLKALETLLSKKGYALVGCNLLGCNAFFVRQDLASETRFCSPFTAENHYEPPRYYLLPAFTMGLPLQLGPYRMP
jgi:arsenate reductase-like glutaredoxin family protein